jgi:hypothetical protein
VVNLYEVRDIFVRQFEHAGHGRVEAVTDHRRLAVRRLRVRLALHDRNHGRGRPFGRGGCQGREVGSARLEYTVTQHELQSRRYPRQHHRSPAVVDEPLVLHIAAARAVADGCAAVVTGHRPGSGGNRARPQRASCGAGLPTSRGIRVGHRAQTGRRRPLRPYRECGAGRSQVTASVADESEATETAAARAQELP